VNRGITQSGDLPVVTDLKDVQQPYDVLTVYVKAEVSSTLADTVVKQKPEQVIFNPGAENAALAEKLTAAGIAWQNACTLVLCRSKQAPFE
jgi:uncharacterized protein